MIIFVYKQVVNSTSLMIPGTVHLSDWILGTGALPGVWHTPPSVGMSRYVTFHEHAVYGN